MGSGQRRHSGPGEGEGDASPWAPLTRLRRLGVHPAEAHGGLLADAEGGEKVEEGGEVQEGVSLDVELAHEALEGHGLELAVAEAAVVDRCEASVASDPGEVRTPGLGEFNPREHLLGQAVQATDGGLHQEGEFRGLRAGAPVALLVVGAEVQRGLGPEGPASGRIPPGELQGLDPHRTHPERRGPAGRSRRTTKLEQGPAKRFPQERRRGCLFLQEPQGRLPEGSGPERRVRRDPLEPVGRGLSRAPFGVKDPGKIALVAPGTPRAGGRPGQASLLAEERPELATDLDTGGFPERQVAEHIDLGADPDQREAGEPFDPAGEREGVFHGLKESPRAHF